MNSSRIPISNSSRVSKPSARKAGATIASFLIPFFVPLYVAWFFYMFRFYLMPYLLGYSVMGMLSFPLESDVSRQIYKLFN